jgi:hypothetical protein
MNRQGFQEWLDRYVEAWKSYDPDQIRALFSDDATYRFHPADEPERGREAIVEAWLDEPDEQGTYDAQYEPLAIDGDVHVARGWSRYFESPGGPTRDEFWNIYVCRFNDAGECTEFIEYWIQDREYRRRSIDQMIRDAGGTPPARAQEGPPAA